ncbi:unnamed protein product [Hydatigera taeniaeformis]|uniref:DUF2088 domain-containing protein n=1 Tax=Hydatigena taeniaeformis TaxID=6205 RepID=A0A0R3XBT2_HYDTA|nr:unnamed protein product [Hydatigera taeniaeformis]
MPCHAVHRRGTFDFRTIIAPPNLYSDFWLRTIAFPYPNVAMPLPTPMTIVEHNCIVPLREQLKVFDQRW